MATSIPADTIRVRVEHARLLAYAVELDARAAHPVLDDDLPRDQRAGARHKRIDVALQVIVASVIEAGSIRLEAGDPQALLTLLGHCYDGRSSPAKGLHLRQLRLLLIESVRRLQAIEADEAAAASICALSLFSEEVPA